MARTWPSISRVQDQEQQPRIMCTIESCATNCFYLSCDQHRDHWYFREHKRSYLKVPFLYPWTITTRSFIINCIHHQHTYYYIATNSIDRVYCGVVTGSEEQRALSLPISRRDLFQGLWICPKWTTLCVLSTIIVDVAALSCNYTSPLDCALD